MDLHENSLPFPAPVSFSHTNILLSLESHRVCSQWPRNQAKLPSQVAGLQEGQMSTSSRPLDEGHVI